MSSQWKPFIKVLHTLPFLFFFSFYSHLPNFSCWSFHVLPLTCPIESCNFEWAIMCGSFSNEWLWRISFKAHSFKSGYVWSGGLEDSVMFSLKNKKSCLINRWEMLTSILWTFFFSITYIINLYRNLCIQCDFI